MSARGKDSGDRRPKDPGKHADPAPDDDEPIEILEVVGVDETTGTLKSEEGGRPAPPPRRGAHHRPAPAEPSRDLEEALKEKEKYHDQLLRKAAEFDNFRKRMEREREEFRAAASADLLKRLLPVLDNLERAITTAAGGAGNPLHQGVALIHQQILDVLKKEGLVPLESLGAPFDPHVHEAVEVLGVPGFEQGIVLEEVQKGYMYRDRLLRPALVKVSAGPRTGGAAEPGERGADPAENRG